MPSTFEKYAERLDLYKEETKDRLLNEIRELNAAVAAVDGKGFEVTPFTQQPRLAAGLTSALGIEDFKDCELWVKDETNNVSGSHKGRHLFGVALDQLLNANNSDAPLAIASCGNAALAAAVVAKAMDRHLNVYVPDWANDQVVEQIKSHGAKVIPCERDNGVVGDPSYLAFQKAVRDGAVPFSCQGSDTPTAIDGGRTLAYEMVDALLEHDDAETTHLDRIIIQVGGGALGRAVVTGLQRMVDRRVLAAMPKVHIVQPVGNHPLIRAWDRIAQEHLPDYQFKEALMPNISLERLTLDDPIPKDAFPEKLLVFNSQRAEAAAELGEMTDEDRQGVIERITANQSTYMEAWHEPPESYATGILDDITYDWIELVDAMLTTGGFPLVASDGEFRYAHGLAHTAANISTCPTGGAGLGGLAGLLALLKVGATDLPQNERIAVLFTGQQRPGDPTPP